MKKRILSLLLATAMAAGLLSGCGGNGEGKEEEQDNPGTVDDGEDEQELTTVRILCKNDMSDTVKTEDWEQYPVSQVFIEELEEIGIRLELECISNESVENVFTTRMASGQNMPDLIAYCWIGNGEQDVLEWAESGLVYPVNELLEQYDLADFAQKLPAQLSGGMRQRCALIRTLATEPVILLLDEPFSALDYQTRLAVSADISRIIRQEHKTAVLVTHDISEAISMSDRIVVLTHRPGTVRAIHDLRQFRALSPLERRGTPEFQTVFNQIWEELDVNV